MPSLPRPDRLCTLIEAALASSDHGTARRLAAEAAARAERDGDRRGLGRASALEARALLVANEPDAALAAAQRAAAVAVETDDPATVARALAIQARVLMGIGETDAALERGLAALDASAATDDPEAAMAPLRELANVYAYLKQWREALRFGERYRAIAVAAGDPRHRSAAIDTFAWIRGGMHDEALERGDVEAAAHHAAEAERLSRAALAIARAAGNLLGAGTILANLAESLSDLGRHPEALALLDGFELAPDRRTPTLRAHVDHTRGIVLGRLGRTAEAIELLARCVAEAPTRPLEITARRALVGLLEASGDLRGALDHQKALAARVAAQSSEQARRAASVAAVRLETAAARALADRYRARAKDLQRSNEQLNRRSEDWRRQAFEDPLTGLPNRRRLDELLEEAPQSHAVAMIDVDHFKQINDLHSHAVGDAVLQAVAGLLRATCRQGDVALRLGGEEFALMLRSDAPGGAFAAAERVRAGVEGFDWEALAGGLAVTVSIGVALADDAASATERLALADARMYAAKAAGRNRVVGPPP